MGLSKTASCSGRKPKAAKAWSRPSTACSTGRHGKYKVTFDRDGRKTSERDRGAARAGLQRRHHPRPALQEMAEKALAAKAKRGAIVIIDPNTGDILAMASWPTFDPNEFVPSISTAKFKELQDDPDIPLLPRAYRSAYPPGSTFKVAVGLAAFESGTITPHDQYECVPAMDVGNTTFHNWKHSDRGSLNFVQALTRIVRHLVLPGRDPDRRGPDSRLGGASSALARSAASRLKGEAEGRLPNDQYMKATHGRKILGGDIANLSIGQGDLLVTPLQMAQSMAIVANGGTFYQTRLVQQVQTVEQRNRGGLFGAGEEDTRRFPDGDGANSHRDGRRRERAGRHRASGKSGQSFGGRKNRDRAMGPEGKGADRGVVCGLCSGGTSAIRVRGAL